MTKIFSADEIKGLVALFESVEDDNPQASLGSQTMHELYAGAVLASLQRASKPRRTLNDPCPQPDFPGCTMQQCFTAKRCACAYGVELGYQPTTRRL